MRAIQRFVPAVVTLSLVALAACNGGQEGGPATTATPAPETGPIKVGVYGSLTGSTATFGQSTKKGIDLAFEEVNAAGGVKGRQVKALHEDDQGKPEEANAVVQKLIGQDKVVAVLGEVASTRSIAGGQVCQPAGVPMITPSSTNPKVTEIGDYIFRVCFIDPFQGEVMAQFASSNLGSTKAAILKDVANDYSVGLAQFFAETFTRLGGTIVAEESYSEGNTDFKGQLTKIRTAQPDVIFVPGYYTEVGLVAQQARDLGMKQPLLGGDGWESPKLLEIGGKALEGSYYSNHYFEGAPIPRIQEFVAKYEARYQEKPDSIAALAYDAAKILASAMERAPSLKGPDLRDAIASTKDHPGVCGVVNFDANRNPLNKPATILQVKDGAIAFVAEVGGVPAPAPDEAAPVATQGEAAPVPGLEPAAEPAPVTAESTGGDH